MRKWMYSLLKQLAPYREDAHPMPAGPAGNVLLNPHSHELLGHVYATGQEHGFRVEVEKVHWSSGGHAIYLTLQWSVADKPDTYDNLLLLGPENVEEIKVLLDE